MSEEQSPSEKKDEKCYLKAECEKYCGKPDSSQKEQLDFSKTPSQVRSGDVNLSGKESSPQQVAAAKKVQKFEKLYRPSAHIDNYDICNYGDKQSGFRCRSGGPQDYYQLLNHHLQTGTLFEDIEFPATIEALYTDPNRQEEQNLIKWLRPHEITNDPQFFSEGYSRFDIQQGAIGDCWFLSAIAALTLYPKYFEHVVPTDQNFQDTYAGIFHFRFWQYGVWVDVVVDDRLPTKDGQLVSVHSAHPHEFWSALLEKAYAKLHGSYETLSSGQPVDALEDLTGGLGEQIDLKEERPNLYELILKSYERMSLMTCNIQEAPPGVTVTNGITENNLVVGLIYSVTRVEKLKLIKGGEVELVRLRNPWGQVEWNGRWKDGGGEWNSIPEEAKENLDLCLGENGEFWMDIKDFVANFDYIHICNLNPQSVEEQELIKNKKKKWDMEAFDGEWVVGVTAGGYPYEGADLEVVATNTQYHITLTEADDNEKECTIIISLLQKTRRQARAASVEYLYCGFVLYSIDANTPKPLDAEFFRNNQVTDRSEFLNLRYAVLRLKLPPGDYCIIPCTYYPNQQGSFLLRVFTEKKAAMEEYDCEFSFEEADEMLNERMKAHQQSGDISADLSEKALIEIERAAFRRIAGDDELVNYVELGQILNEVFGQSTRYFHEFTPDMCRALLVMKDSDNSGQLDYQEFIQLLEELKIWIDVFISGDTNKSGAIDRGELLRTFTSCGFKIPKKVINLLVHRYADRNGEISIESFIVCLLKLRTLRVMFINMFQQRELSPDDFYAVALATC